MVRHCESAQLAAQTYELANRLKYHDPHFSQGQGELEELGEPLWLANFAHLVNQLLQQLRGNSSMSQCHTALIVGMLADAWNAVTSATIRNCFEHAFRIPGCSIATSSDCLQTEGDDESQVLSALKAHNIAADLDSYAATDDNLCVCREDTLDDLVAEVLPAQHSSESEEEPEVENVTTAQAFQYIAKVGIYYGQESGYEGHLAQPVSGVPSMESLHGQQGQGFNSEYWSPEEVPPEPEDPTIEDWEQLNVECTSDDFCTADDNLATCGARTVEDIVEEAACGAANSSDDGDDIDVGDGEGPPPAAETLHALDVLRRAVAADEVSDDTCRRFYAFEQSLLGDLAKKKRQKDIRDFFIKK
ncbi:hypothetical protein HPB51_021603 [Rhipicephalus microplus]|uniref:Tick transposon n=1 Tax=Rhipicephalus microplus TaxID=6941 RepID=A0A9J6EJH5_RHIMP|nr:hypothetical protein HPB51_021603 [Rhipicephalus microplus]